MKIMQSVILLLLCVASIAANAESLPDPTRPPTEVGEGGGMSNAVLRPTAKGLLSVIISANRCAAIIDGKTYQLGDQYGAATLVEITPTGIVLYSRSGMRNMGLFPGVGVKVIAPGAAVQTVKCKIENYKTDNKLSRKNGLKGKK